MKPVPKQKYENYICSDQNMIKQLEKKEKEAG
jgi:hypothetical protein